MSIAIVTDTNSGIFEKEAKELGVYIVPMPVVIDEQVYYEGKDLSEETFYGALEQGKSISTSQPAPGDLMEVWDHLLENGYDQIIYIPMSSGLSGSCMSAKMCAQDYEGKVFVVDNHRISVTLRQSAITAKSLADEGATAEAIVERLEKNAYDASIYLAVNTLEYLKKGGRVTPAAAMIGTLLNIRPILSIQGEKLDAYAKVHGSMRKTFDKMVEAIKADIAKRFADVKTEDLHLFLAGTNLDQEAVEGWKQLAREAFPGMEPHYDPLSISIGTHTGPGALGVGICVE